MLEIDLNDAEFKSLAASLPEQHLAAAASVLRSVSNEINRRYQQFARTADFGPFSPLTISLRKGFGKLRKSGTYTRTGYGKWIGDFSRYYVDPDNLVAMVGILSAEDIDKQKARFVPISRGFARSAKRHAGGFAIDITRQRQRQLAKALMQTYGREADWIHSIIPRVGTHVVKPRPIAGPVFAATREAAIRTCLELYRIKMSGLRYTRGAPGEMLTLFSKGAV